MMLREKNNSTTNLGSSTQQETPLIEFKDVYKIYHMGDTEVRAADGISLKVNKGEFVAIVGQSGSGKSTCMNIIGCLDVPTTGKFYLGGKDVSQMNDDQQAEIRNKMLGFIFQQYNLLPKLTLLENVEVSMMYAGVSKGERDNRALKALERVGLDKKAKNLPSQLSGGQQQRVSIARALVGNPSVILADEPTGALDSKTGRDVLKLLQEIHEDGNTIVLITHDNSIAAQAERIIRLEDGKVVYDGPANNKDAVVRAEGYGDEGSAQASPVNPSSQSGGQDKAAETGRQGDQKKAVAAAAASSPSSTSDLKGGLRGAAVRTVSRKVVTS